MRKSQFTGGRSLSNNESNPDRISDDLANILFNKPVRLPRRKVAIQLDEKILERYVGDYQLRPKVILTITKNEVD